MCVVEKWTREGRETDVEREHPPSQPQRANVCGTVVFINEESRGKNVGKGPAKGSLLCPGYPRSSLRRRFFETGH